MRLTSSRAYTRPTPVPKMPPGMVEIMEGLARDVLKNNPTNVYEFCANHMEKLLEIRDGPSSIKRLTLDQKISKAQAKVRQRAKERQEKFDKEIQLLSNKCDEDGTTHEINDTLLTKKDTVVPILKAPIHHEHDLEHASEIEISHADKVPLTEVSDALQVNELNAIEEDIHEAITENLEGAEKVEVEQKNCDKSDDEQICEKVEKEVHNTETIEIVVQELSAESPLQTITEASDENSMSECIIILPEITIGDDHNVRTSENKAEKSVQEIQLDVMNELEKGNSSEKNEVEANIKSNTPKDLLEKKKLNEDDELLDMESIAIKSVPEASDNVSDSVNDSETLISNNKSTERLTDSKNQNGCESVEISEIINLPMSINTIETKKDSDAGNVQQVNGPAEAIPKNDSQNIVITLVDVPKVEELQNENSNNEQIHNDTEVDGNQKIQITIDNLSNDDKIIERETVEGSATESTASCEKEAVDENIYESVIQKLHSNNPKSDTVLEPSEMQKQQKVEINKENLEKYSEKYHDNKMETLLQKADSTDNINEDSISIVESDFSKTDDDSSQNIPNNMDLETAAVTIQKVFRSFMFKSRNSTFEDTTNDEHNSIDEDNDKKEEYYAAANLNKERRPLGITRMDTVLQTVNEEKSLSLSTDDSSTLSSAATTIQAHVRGFLVRNKLNSSKTFSMNSLVNSYEVFENDSEQQKNKTILNIHIVPQEANYLSRDESLITSMDLSLDGSPPSSVNLHPLSYDISERRKMLKREDAVQSISPPSNNSGKLSEDSVKEVLINENGVLEREPTDDKINETADQVKDLDDEAKDVMSFASTVTPTTIITISKSEEALSSPREYSKAVLQRNGRSFTKMSSDESDVITPFVPSPRNSENVTTLLHSGEFHDVVLPTKVSRNDTSVVRGE